MNVVKALEIALKLKAHYPSAKGVDELIECLQPAHASESIAEKAKRKGWKKPLHSMGSWLRDYRHSDQNLSKED